MDVDIEDIVLAEDAYEYISEYLYQAMKSYQNDGVQKKIDKSLNILNELIKERKPKEKLNETN